MPTSVRIGEEQLNHLAFLARQDCSISGRVFVKNHENSCKWQHRWSALYQNFLFHFESEDSTKLAGATYLEHSTCERLCLTNLKDENKVGEMFLFQNRACLTFQLDHGIIIELPLDPAIEVKNCISFYGKGLFLAH